MAGTSSAPDSLLCKWALQVLSGEPQFKTEGLSDSKHPWEGLDYLAKIAGDLVKIPPHPTVTSMVYSWHCY